MKSEPTALVTGASSGVGVHFARELAARNFNLILSARRVDRLEAVKQSLQAEFNVDVTVLPGDLSSPTGAKRLFEDVRQLDQRVTLLVNNAGLGKFGTVFDQSIEEIESVIQVNVTSLTVLTRLFAAEMKEQGGGYILNHASFSAIQPPTLYSVYAGTKSYVLAFSQALRQDLRPHKVRISALCPGFFQSEFFELAGQSPTFMVRRLILPPERIARAGIRGVLRGKAIIIPGWRYRLISLIMRGIPRTVATGLADFAMKH
jgi:short-subunit dehydrogenase